MGFTMNPDEALAAAREYVQIQPYIVTERGDFYDDDQLALAWINGRIAGLSAAAQIITAVH